ncbi:hypothetical protein Btru_021561 [Bulinus truncatus]|nr:hypothetical protein Btru_021561 [Bulinus truncatus]
MEFELPETALPGDAPTEIGELPILKSFDESSAHLNGSTNSRHTSFGTSTYLSYDLYPHEVENNRLQRQLGEDANHLIFRTSNSGGWKPRGVAKRFQKYATTRQLPPFQGPWGLGKSETDARKSHTIGPNTIPLSQLKNFLSSSVPRQRYGANGFLELEKKETSISFFDIVTERVSSYQYRPGEEISGTINIYVQNSIHLRFVELIVVGKGLFSVRESRNDLPLTLKETYLYRKKCVIGSKNKTVILPRGQYATKFRIHLPKDLPSSLHYDDELNSFTCDVGYSIIARVCDSSRFTKGSTSQPVPKVLISKQINFTVLRSFDIARIYDRWTSVSHTEQLSLSCCHGDTAVVTVNLERAVYLAGDDVRLEVIVTLPNRHAVKKISCFFQEQITLGPKYDPVTITLCRVDSKDDSGLPKKGGNTSFSIVVPTNIDLVSPFSLVPSKAKVSYFLSIKVLLNPTKGKLTFKVPVIIGPCAEPIYGEKSSSNKIVPIFNKPIRFPTFSRQMRSGQLATDVEHNNSSSPADKSLVKPNQIEAKYEHGFWSWFMCCFIRDYS